MTSVLNLVSLGSPNAKVRGTSQAGGAEEDLISVRNSVGAWRMVSSHLQALWSGTSAFPVAHLVKGKSEQGKGKVCLSLSTLVLNRHGEKALIDV